MMAGMLERTLRMSRGMIGGGGYLPAFCARHCKCIASSLIVLRLHGPLNPPHLS